MLMEKNISGMSEDNISINELPIIRRQDVERYIIEIRGEQVLLDRDVAGLYGVETKHVNQALRNNPEKFPKGYYFTLQPGEKQELVKTFDRFAALKHSSVEPHAFSERGLYMLATILKSEKAYQTTIAIIDSFAMLRELSHSIEAIHREQDNTRQKTLIQKTGELLSELLSGDAETTQTESTVELNLMAIKFKHTVKRTKKRDK